MLHAVGLGRQQRAYRVLAPRSDQPFERVGDLDIQRRASGLECGQIANGKGIHGPYLIVKTTGCSSNFGAASSVHARVVSQPCNWRADAHLRRRMKRRSKHVTRAAMTAERTPVVMS